MFLFLFSILFAALPVFGITLEEAVKRSMLPDGVHLPRIVRECIMHIEEKGWNKKIVQ